MKTFEYQITLHPADDFKEVVYFCAENGDCEAGDVPSSQVEKLEAVLNQQGRKGWEMVQMSFGRQGVLIVWKRTKDLEDPCLPVKGLD